ncbi:MAG: LysR substrate-binding domain-containing protein, partial [Deltaproteobacteria bacterium]
SKGAEELLITQSTASQHIQTLEIEFGVKLFDRGQSGALLTEAGKLFLERARRICSECETSVKAMHRFRDMDDVVLRIGASSIPGTKLIPAILGDFIEKCPKVRLEVIQGDSGSVVQQLVAEEIELGFTGRHFDDDHLKFAPIGNDSIICVVSPELLNQGKKSLSQAELCKVPMVMREQGSGSQQAVYESLAGTWIRKEALRIVAELGSDEAVKHAVLNGTGYAFISSMSVTEELNSGRLVTVRIPNVDIERKFFAVSRSGRELSPAATTFLELMLRSNRK